MKRMITLCVAVLLCVMLLGGLTASAALEVNEGAGEGDVIDWNDLFDEEGENATEAATTTAAAEEKKGCSGSIGCMAGIVTAAFVGTAVALRSKKEQE